LIDDIRIREFLLAPLDSRVADLMDRRFVALKATDDQEAAVAIFRQYDRTALPVTDTAGMLIGIVTIDDMLDVVEATATEDIQRIGGSEALDEPYISIAFGRMIQKRAGWLTALFLGEMLTATAMAAFEAENPEGGRSRPLRAAHHLERRQLRLTSVDPCDPRVGARRSRLPRLVACDAPGDFRRLGARRDSWRHRLLRITLWSAFSNTTASIGSWCRDRVSFSDRCGAVGNAQRIAVAVPPETTRVRPRRFLRAVCRHAGRRDGPGDLLLRRPRRPAGHAALTVRSRTRTSWPTARRVGRMPS